MKSEQYLREIRESAGLPRAVLRKITIEGKIVTFALVTDVTYSEEDVAHAARVSARYVPAGCEARVTVLKSVPSAEGVRATVMERLKCRNPAAAAFLTEGDVEVAVDRTGGRFALCVGESERAQLMQDDVINVLSAELSRMFCGAWIGEIRTVPRAAAEIEREQEAPPETLRAPRVFRIENYSPIDGADCTYALYLDDLKGEQQNVTVCGVLTYCEERVAKNERPYFLFTLSDGTGQLRASYFSRKATIEKVRELRQGDSVCLTGANELFHGTFRFTAKQVDRGAPPKGFVPESRPSRPVPARYTCVFPEPAEDPVQADLFGSAPLPAELTAGKFVVFDLETTGLNSNPVGGVMDRIIEIGAVRIEGGQIREKFSSFVACPTRLSAEIVKLTGITDDMLVGAPETADVIADFYKFADGCALVGHNVNFDHGFVKYYGEQEGYVFDHRLYDTVAFAQEMLRLPNYKLNTVADFFGFTFNHHRAFDDAFVTAKIFLELARKKGGLPR